MTYKEVYKMVKKAGSPVYGQDYLRKATGIGYKDYTSDLVGLPIQDWDLYKKRNYGGYYLLNNLKGSNSTPVTQKILNNRLWHLGRGIYDYNSVPEQLLYKDISAQARRKRNQYNTTGQVTPSRVWKAGQRLPSGLKVTPENANAINKVYRQSASTNRPSSAYKPA